MSNVEGICENSSAASCRTKMLQLALSHCCLERRAVRSHTSLTHRTMQWQPRGCPTDQTRCWTRETRDSESHSTRAVRQSAVKRFTPELTSKNNPEPQTDVARHSPEYSHTLKGPALMPFDHSLTSSAEVLAKRLIGTCA